jgi:regulator of sirC expression with transglutaminase-like and TPR domain
MNATAKTRSTALLSESQRAALINLLSDDDPSVYKTVREKIISLGTIACDWLRPLLLSNDAVLRRHSRDILRHFNVQDADNRFLGFCLKHGEDLDIERGAWLLAQTQYPDINADAYVAILDAYADVLREQIDFTGDGQEILSTLNSFLFGRLEFSGNQDDYYDPGNSYLNSVIDRRQGNPISLCLVYILLARRLKLPIAGIGLPGHFLCRYQSTAEEIYIDVFNHGRFLSKADCVQHLVQGHHGVLEEYLWPVSPRRMLMRICGNLHQIYLRRGASEDTTRFQRYLIALAR